MTFLKKTKVHSIKMKFWTRRPPCCSFRASSEN